jgi:hypothetical protein
MKLVTRELRMDREAVKASSGSRRAARDRQLATIAALTVLDAAYHQGITPGEYLGSGATPICR